MKRVIALYDMPQMGSPLALDQSLQGQRGPELWHTYIILGTQVNDTKKDMFALSYEYWDYVNETTYK